MRVATGRAIVAGAVLAALFPGATAWADVKAGVDAWSRGDYAAAVHEWQGPADAGDPDAMFNLGQAYRLGRGVPRDPAKAEQLYARAAAKGHLGAADTYGLMLFQDGRREAALPYLQDAAKRGDPRAQYLLGIASFNGDLLPQDWVKAYALVTLANQHNLPQAASALAQMDCLRYGDGEAASTWQFSGPKGTRRIRVRGPLLVNNSELLRDAVLQGLGIALLPDFVVADDLEAGHLVRLLPRWKPRPLFGSAAHLVWLPTRHLPPKTRAFVDFLLGRIGNPRKSRAPSDSTSSAR